MTVAEVFLEDCYVRDLTLPDNPVVIDVGGFIGDFSLYAVKRLNARRGSFASPRREIGHCFSRTLPITATKIGSSP
jgi:hypothetical protein